MAVKITLASQGSDRPARVFKFSHISRIRNKSFVTSDIISKKRKGKTMKATVRTCRDNALNVTVLGGSECRGEMRVALFSEDDNRGELGRVDAEFKNIGYQEPCNFACALFRLGQEMVPGKYLVVIHLEGYAPLRKTIEI
jgi:hypothetical protein